ncbi:MAG: arylsulfatase [Chthoniobacter sp.]|uniref:arylsulfatase n=1 Tax=Chthoniobacter sp. TaxID=2510640 RepID=UPI0032AE6158
MKPLPRPWTALFALAAMVLLAPHAAAKPPSIILVMADDVGYGGFSCLGNPVVQTPNFDRFYRQSVRFTNFHVSPTSSATRAALFTGRHEFRSGVTHTMLERERMRLDATTIAQILKSAGYATGIFGQWHLGDEPAYQPDKRGFDETFIHGGGALGETLPGSGGDAPGNTPFDPKLLHNGEFVETLGFSTDVFFHHAIEWMDEQLDAGIPYFACIMPTAAHEPPLCPPEYERPYLRKVPPKLAAYFGMIANLDDNFGHLLDKLQEWGSEETTLVIFLTDHGGTPDANVYNAMLRGGQGSPYEGGTRVPFFWRWSGQWKAGADVAALTAHLDLFPTLAHIAGAEIPAAVAAKLEGRDLLPLLKDPSAEWPDRLLYTHVAGWPRGEAAKSQHANTSVRDSRFTLVNNAELYDLQDDPSQMKNVLSSHAGEAGKLRSAYDRWWEDIQPDLVNENAVGPKVNAFKERYWKQFGGGPAPKSPDSK